MRIASRVGWAAALALLAGCAASPSHEDRIEDPPAVELERVPFHPQVRYQCGPAALATVLNASGVEVDPPDLTPRIYLPERRGSLQAELVGAVRHYQRLPYPLEPRLKAILDELQAGRPVLVLQNLGVAVLPRWHYAVVIGYDPDADTVLLRSGRERRKRMPVDLFMKTWKRADHWALVTLRPGSLPADPDMDTYMRAAADLEATGQLAGAARAYAAAAQHWPRAHSPWLGLGNVHYLQDEYAAAEQAYRQALSLAPGDPVVHNNLAQALLARGCHAAAMEQVQRGLAGGVPEPALRGTLEATAREIRDAASQAGTSSVGADCPSVSESPPFQDLSISAPSRLQPDAWREPAACEHHLTVTMR